MEIIIDKRFKNEPNAEASCWIERILQFKKENQVLLEKIQSNSKEKKRIEKLLYSKYKIRFNTNK